jgi:hypothetical protein
MTYIVMKYNGALFYGMSYHITENNKNINSNDNKESKIS